MELNTLIQEIWAKIATGGSDRQHPFHFPVLGTAHPHQGCKLRTVVLRKVIAANRQLICYTDARSPKVAEIRLNSHVEWLFYHPSNFEQIRAAGSMTIHIGDDFSKNHWQKVPDAGRRDYLSQTAPGTPIQNPQIPLIQGDEENFCVLTCNIHQLDWLVLKRDIHQRALFSWEQNSWKGTWVTP